MDNKTFYYYTLSSLIDNCELACLAYELYIDTILKDTPLITINYRMLNTYHLYNLFSYTANVSKFYSHGYKATHPNYSMSESRKKFLNDKIPLLKDSQIKDRDIRNSLEHFHERIDNYFYGLYNKKEFDLDITDIYAKKIVKNDNTIIYVEILFYKSRTNITNIYHELTSIKDKAFDIIGDYHDIEFVMNKRNEKAKKYGFKEAKVKVDKNGKKTYYV